MTPAALRSFHHRLGLTQSEFAALLGVSQESVSTSEREGRDVRPKVREAVEKMRAKPARAPLAALPEGLCGVCLCLGGPQLPCGCR